ncbi:hypothetical protein N752_04750 [Desulforamulus aquiferis]|nr:YbaB/EbfC family nucleoid-associated protein [Desulforamulus aquiferis]RYD06201.1 hypothetical protein N752_04750 [Desulforamulus aquiferis]
MFGNLGGILSQVQNMHESLKGISVEISVGDGAVSVQMDGSQQLQGIKINPDLIKGDITQLEDLVVESLRISQQETRNKVQEEVAKLTGINIGNYINMFQNRG